MQYITKGPSQATHCLGLERASCAAAANDGAIYLSGTAFMCTTIDIIVTIYGTTNGCFIDSLQCKRHDYILLLLLQQFLAFKERNN